MIPFLQKYESLERGNLVFSYTGSPTGEMINLILQLAENRLDVIEENSRLKKKIINILIEILQNIFHHRDQFISYKYDSFIFFLFQKEDGYLIVSGNYISRENSENLMKKIENYTSLSGSEIKETYREVLGDGTFSDKGGAGLGLLDIIRKSGGNLNHEFIKVDDNKLFFLMEITLKP